MKLFIYMRFTFLLLLFPISLFGQNHCYVNYQVILNEDSVNLPKSDEFYCEPSYKSLIFSIAEQDELAKYFSQRISKSSLLPNYDYWIENGSYVDPTSLKLRNNDTYMDATILSPFILTYKQVKGASLSDFHLVDSVLCDISVSTHMPIPTEWMKDVINVDDPFYDSTERAYQRYDTVLYRMNAGQLNFTEDWNIDSSGITKNIIGVGLNRTIDPHGRIDFCNLVDTVDFSMSEAVLFKSNVVYSVSFYKKIIKQQMPKNLEIQSDNEMAFNYYSNFTTKLFGLIRQDYFDTYEFNPQQENLKDQFTLISSAPIDILELHEKTVKGGANKCSIKNNLIEFLSVISCSGFQPKINSNEEFPTLDENGEQVMETLLDTAQIHTRRLAGFRFLEDWYIHPETGALYKDVKGMMLLFYWYDENGAPIVYPWAGKTVYIRFHE